MGENIYIRVDKVKNYSTQLLQEFSKPSKSESIEWRTNALSFLSFCEFYRQLKHFGISLSVHVMARVMPSETEAYHEDMR